MLQKFVEQVQSRGDQAGAVLVTADDKQIISKLAAQFGYNLMPIGGDSRGLHAA